MNRIISTIFFFFLGGNFLLFAQEGAARIDYLNKSLPDSTPVLFAKGIISTEDYEHGSPAFSPFYDEIYWSVRIDGEYGKEIIKFINKEEDKWSEPKIPQFSIEGKGDLYPTFSSDGNEIYFTSDRSVPNGQDTINRFIWKVKRNGSTWSQTEVVGFDSLDIYGLSITINGSLYFMAQPVKERGTRVFDIYFSQLAEGKYTKPEKLGHPISTDYYEDCPFVSADERFLIFESNRPGGFGGTDLYVSTKTENDNWSLPKNLGKIINSESSERFPYISPDGKYFFFGSDRTGNYNIYWIDASVIYDLISELEL
jgi:hypothetical protein